MSSIFLPSSLPQSAGSRPAWIAAFGGSAFFTRRRILLSAGFVLVAAIAAGWFGGGKYFFIAKRFGVVIPGQLYRSGQISKWVQEDQWNAYGIRAVIDLNGIEPTDLDQKHEIERTKELGLEHRRFPLRGDGTGDVVRYADAIEAIVKFQKSNVPVLVHCSAGAQRTGGVVATYRVLVQGWSTDDALDEMQVYTFRPKRDVRLIPYLNANIGELAALLKERGVISEIPSPLPQFTP